MTRSMEEVIAMWSDALSDSYSAQDLIWKLYGAYHYAGTRFVKCYTINFGTSVRYLRRYVEFCSIPVHSLKELFRNHQSFVGLRLLIEKVTNGDRYSIYFSGLVTQTSNTDRESIEVGGDVA